MKYTIKNNTNTPFDLQGGVRLPAMGEVTADFDPAYVEVLKLSLSVDVVEKSAAAAKAEPESDLREEYKALTGKDADGRWKDERVAEEIAKLKE